MFAIFTLYSTVKECLSATKVIRADLRAVLGHAVEYCSARPCRLDSMDAQGADACLSGPDIRGVQSTKGFDEITETPLNTTSLEQAVDAAVPEPTTSTVDRQAELELNRALEALRKSIAELTAVCRVVKSPHHIATSGVLAISGDALAETPAPEAVVPLVVLAEEIGVPQVATDAILQGTGVQQLAIDATQQNTGIPQVLTGETLQDTGVQQLATEATIQDTGVPHVAIESILQNAGVPQVTVPDDVPQVVAVPQVDIEVSQAEVLPIPPPDAQINPNEQTSTDSVTSDPSPWYDLGDAYYITADLLTPEQQAQTEPFEFSFGYAPCTWDGLNWFTAEYRVLVTPPWC